MRILMIVGTRPEAIKMAPVFLAIKKNHPKVEIKIVSTGQHDEMLTQAFSVFGLSPDLNLRLMRENQSLVTLSARILETVYEVLLQEKPDVVLVHGDTTTCLYSALACSYAKIPVGHVEAGLRTYNFNAPWPEEMNRRLTDPISRFCFAPTNIAKINLLNEGIPIDNIFVTGNTVIDALLLARDIVRERPPKITGINQNVFEGRRIILVTGHRRESFGDPFINVCKALKQIVQNHDDADIVFPVHLNPNVCQVAYQLLGGSDRIHLINPVEYLEFVYLMDTAILIITDSGGVQEEAPSFGKKVLVTRETTERPEAVECGIATLVGTDFDKIVAAADDFLNNESNKPECEPVNPYGDGLASCRIAKILVDQFQK